MKKGLGFKSNVKTLSEDINMVLDVLKEDSANITPLALLGEIVDNDTYICVAFDHNNYSDEYYKCNCPTAAFWYEDNDCIKYADEAIRIDLEALLLHCFKGSKGYKDEWHSFLPNDEKDIRFMAEYAAKMIANGYDMTIG